ncbi:MAG: hypothetical protein V3U24_10200 [Candidatus Neomarinimicrobiota bacterium]
MKKLYDREYEGIIRTTVIVDNSTVVTDVFESVRPVHYAGRRFCGNLRSEGLIWD